MGARVVVGKGAATGSLPLESVPFRAASMEKGRPAVVGFRPLSEGGSIRLKGDRELRFLERRPIRLCLGERPAGAEEIPEGNVKVWGVETDLSKRGEVGVIGLLAEREDFLMLCSPGRVFKLKSG